MTRSTFRISAALMLALAVLTLPSCTDAGNLAQAPNVSASASPSALSPSPSDSPAPAKNTGDPSQEATASDSAGPFDIDVKIACTITLDDKVKDVDPNIIRAARQALFDDMSAGAMFSHYNGYDMRWDVYIFEVDKTGLDTWEVRFWQKAQDTDTYNKQGYSWITVEKQPSGSFKGFSVNPGGPAVIAGETY